MIWESTCNFQLVFVNLKKNSSSFSNSFWNKSSIWISVAMRNVIPPGIGMEKVSFPLFYFVKHKIVCVFTAAGTLHKHHIFLSSLHVPQPCSSHLFNLQQRILVVLFPFLVQSKIKHKTSSTYWNYSYFMKLYFSEGIKISDIENSSFQDLLPKSNRSQIAFKVKT